MSDHKKFNDDDKSKKNGEFKVPPRTWILWIAILGSIPLLMMFRDKANSQGVNLSQFEFTQKVDSNLISHAVVVLDTQSPYLREISGRYYKTDTEGNKVMDNGKPVEVPFHTLVFLTDEKLQTLLSNPIFEPKRPNAMLLGLVYSVFPILVIGLLIWFFFIRQIKMAGKGALSFGKSKARHAEQREEQNYF